MRRERDIDPLTEALRPDPNETPQERAQRQARELEAKQVNDRIDAEIEAERKRTKYGDTVKILLLGQSESGKSTTLKQFQLIFAAAQFAQERISWKYVVQLNLIRSIRIILEQLANLTTTRPIPFEDGKPSRTVHPLAHLASPSRPNGSTSSLAISSQSSCMSSDSDLPSTNASIAPSRTSHHVPPGNASPITPITRSSTTPFSPPPIPPVPSASVPAPIEMPKLSDYHRTLRMRLLPLLHLEKSLLKRLDPSGEDFEATQLGTNWFTGGKELFVRSTSNWKEKLSRLRKSNTETEKSGNGPIEDFDDPDDPSNVIHACRDDMMALWHDPVVRQVLRIGGVRLEEMPGFFLDNIERITEIGYVPSDDDVLRARLKTLGVSEYTYPITMMGEKTEWAFYDVGGTRTQRPAWQPYFSHVDALIFLAPISAFDQSLVEDRRVNRLEDSLLLFKAICKSVLLKDVNIVLFLNKVDILKSKLDNGVKVNKYVRSYAERPNEYESVSKFFRSKFVSIYQQNTRRETRRAFYVHMTTVTQTGAMRSILSSVCDAIFRANLQQTNLA